MLKLYNQLTKSETEFYPENPKNVKIYTCGPTVYSYAHIGNLTSYIYWDLLIRTLTLNGYQVNRVLNLTDVGHLASDADDGEDKLEKGARREGKSVWEIAEKYIATFLKDFRELNLMEPQKIARATDYIKQDQELVQSLIDKGYTYETSDGIYFNTAKFPAYADFARLNLENLKAGARVEFNPEKRNPSDFAIWKFIHKGEDHAMQWDFLGRPGYPGWHLECATIIHEELDNHKTVTTSSIVNNNTIISPNAIDPVAAIDIHTGGVDHIPVHHTNEIAEYECGYGKKLANFWLHCNFITIDGEKISKSLGNIYTLDDLAARGFSALDFKLWVLQGHYRSERNFSFEDLAAAKTRRLNWRNRIARLYQDQSQDQDIKIDVPSSSTPAHQASAPNFSRQTIMEIVGNNLNSAEVLAKVDNSKLTLSDWEFIDQLLGLNLLATTPDISDELKAKITEREAARKVKDFSASDRLRDELAAKNLTILDTSSGPIWQYLS